MYLVLQQVSGTATIYVRRGQKASVGRTEWADHSFPHDAAMQPVHFTLECSQTGAIAIPADGGQLLLDGEPTVGSTLRHGQLLQAGGTSFKVLLEGVTDAEAPIETNMESLSDEKAAVPVEDSNQWVSAAETLEALSMSPIAEDVTPPPAGPVELAQLLAATSRQADALQVIAWSVGRADAVTWAADCIENYLAPSLTESEQVALTAARIWCSEQSEASCAAAGAAAEAGGTDTPPGWVAQAAFWSGDNLSTSDLPPVKPPPALASAGVKGAIVSLAFVVSPDDPVALMNECLAVGFRILQPEGE